MSGVWIDGEMRGDHAMGDAFYKTGGIAGVVRR